MTMRVTILGCGSSGGVPLIGCSCAVCCSDNPKNTRTRMSILLEKDGYRLLVDMSPDLRQQALRHNIATVDAILCTHAHADHCHGIDEVRSFNYNADAVIPIYAMPETIAELEQRFDYVFMPRNPAFGWYKAQLTAHILRIGLDNPDEVQMLHLPSEDNPIFTLQCFTQNHGDIKTIGFRCGDFAYSTDVNKLDEQQLQVVEKSKLWLVDSLGEHPMPTHAHVDLALDWIKRADVERGVLIHLGHALDYDALAARLPANVTPAYDGMILEV